MVRRQCVFHQRFLHAMRRLLPSANPGHCHHQSAALAIARKMGCGSVSDDFTTSRQNVMAHNLHFGVS